MTSNDAVRFCLYSKFIKSLDYLQIEGNDSVLSALHMALDPQHLFPNLRALCIENFGREGYGTLVLPVLLNSKIHKFAINGRTEAPTTSLIDRLVDSLSTWCTRLQDVDIDYSDSFGRFADGQLSDKAAAWLQQCPAVDSVSLHFPPTPALWSAIGRRKTIKRLFLQVNFQTVGRLLTSQSPEKIAVPSITLHGDFNAIPELLSLLINAKSIKRLEPREMFSFEDNRTLEPLAELVNLEDFRLEHREIPWEDLRYILSCKQLLFIVIKLENRPRDFGPSAIREMAASWPKLRTFHLKFLSRVPSPIRLRDLNRFTRHCPQLEELELKSILYDTKMTLTSTRLSGNWTSWVWNFHGIQLGCWMPPKSSIGCFQTFSESTHVTQHWDTATNRLGGGRG